MEYVSITSAVVLSSAGLAVVLENACNKHIKVPSKIMIIYFWICSFLPFFLVPLDFSFFHYKQEQKTALGVLWKIYYFLNLLNGQMLLPIMIAWISSGYVIMRERATSALFEVALWIAFKVAMLILSVILGIAIAVYCFHVEVNVLNFLSQNAINWMNSMSAKKVLPSLYRLPLLRTVQHSSAAYRALSP